MNDNAGMEFDMSELTTAVNELLKGRHAEENLHIYAEGLSALYKRFAGLRLAMNYYTFSEMYSEMNRETVKLFDAKISLLQKLVNGIMYENNMEVTEEDIVGLRKDLISMMEILTAYVDRLQICEYILNRTEYKFKPSGYDNEYYNNEFENDICRYVLSDRDNTVINMKITQIVGQIPMRLSKNKFYDMIKDAFSLYRGSEKQTTDDFAYMIRTAGGMYTPDGFETALPELNSVYNALINMETENITESTYEENRTLFDKASALVDEYSNFCMMMTDIVNDVYTLYLNNEALTEVNENEKIKSIIGDAYDIIEGYDVKTDDIDEKFAELEGVQEKLSNMLLNPESAMNEIYEVNAGIISEKGYEKKLNKLMITSRLQSGSTFATLEIPDELKEPADEEYINGITDRLITEFSRCFEDMDRIRRRAVMSMVISVLPSFFNNMDEFKKYVHVALSQCTDTAERHACMSLINMIMASE